MTPDKERSIWAPDALWRTSYWQRSVFEGEARDLPEVPVKGNYQLSRELFTRLFSFPRQQDKPTPGFEHHQGLWEDLEKIPEWQKLRDSVRGYAPLAGAATKEILKQLVDQLQERQEQEPDKSPEELIQDLLSHKDPKTGSIPGRVAVRRAARKQAQQSEQVKAVMKAAGMEPGKAQDSDIRRAMELAGRVDIAAIMRLAGRLIGEYRNRASKKATRAMQEIAAIKPGDDLSRLVSSELAILAEEDEDLEALFYQRWLEKRLLQYDIRPPQGRKRGPIVVLVDSSGSMEGDNYTVAQAVTIAMGFMAHRQRRPFWGVMFDSSARPAIRLDEPGKLMDWMTTFLGGGTSFDGAIREGLKVVTTQDARADLVMVTDGYANVSTETMDVLKASGARLHVLLVPGGQGGNLAQAAATISEISGDPKDPTVLRVVDAMEGAE